MNNDPNMYIRINKNTAHYYNDIDLYSLVNERYVLYKPAGHCIPKSKVLIGNIPAQLFIKNTDGKATPEMQRKFKYELDNLANLKNAAGIKGVLVQSVTSCIKPNLFSLNGFKVVLNTLIEKFGDNADFFVSISKVSCRGDIVANRSVNCAMLLLAYCIENNVPKSDWLDYAIAGLVHDIGQLRLSIQYKIPEKDMTNKEHERYREHTFDGFSILTEEFNLDVTSKIALAALKHHEFKDGKGYPNGEEISNSFIELITVVDTYTRIVFEDVHISVKGALSRMKNMVKRGELNRVIFEKFMFTII